MDNTNSIVSNVSNASNASNASNISNTPTTLTNKEKYSEVLTPYFLVQEICDKFILDDIVNKYNIKKVFEPGSGHGIFYDVAQNKNNLFTRNNNNKYGTSSFNYVMNEINPDYNLILNNLIHKSHRKNTLVVIHDFMTLDLGKSKNTYDLFWGNLPFNTNHRKFVPGLNKKNNLSSTQLGLSDSRTLWTSITHKAFEQVLTYGGIYCCIIPIIWLKEDKAKIYDLFVQTYKILFLKIYDSCEANKIFSYNCQTPVCYVCVQKINVIEKPFLFQYYDKIQNDFIPFHCMQNYCIPTHFAKFFDFHSQYFNEIKLNHPSVSLSNLGQLVIKINTMKPIVVKNKICDIPNGNLQNYKTKQGEFHIITGSTYCKHGKEQYCGFNDTHGVLGLNGFISKIQGPHYGVKKLILPHKRLAKFIKDYDGTYSVYGRDMYVFPCKSNEELDFLCKYFQIDFVQTMINLGFKIRMNFIEKHVFNYFPNLYGHEFLMQDYLDKMKNIYY